MGSRKQVKLGLAFWPGLLFAVLLVLFSGHQGLCQTPDISQAIKLLAQQAENDLHQQKLSEATAEYRKLLALDPDNVTAHSNLGLAYYMQRDYARAAAEFEIALHHQPDLLNIVALCGLSEAQSGDNSNAVVHLNRAFAEVREPSLRMATGRQLYRIFVESGDLVRASEVIVQLQRIDPSDVDVLYAEHQVYSLLAYRAFESLARVDPDSGRMYEIQGDEMAQVRNVPGAIAAYRLAIQHNPHLTGVHFALGEALSASHSPEQQAEAESEYKKALGDDPWDEKAECRLGNIELERSNLQAALVHFKRAIQLQPSDPEANKGLGVALMELGSNREAVAYLNRAVQFDPYDETAYYRLSLASRNAGDIDAAMREMEEFRALKAKKDQLKRNFLDLLEDAARMAQNPKSFPSAAGPGGAAGTPPGAKDKP
ncbi:MAG TPA: tetratricopeptide repeat protein [Candidatus Cybelea sp.]|nr:tetratricopeptide repeat protein [Candidatus Cybelea sp.]